MRAKKSRRVAWLESLADKDARQRRLNPALKLNMASFESEDHLPWRFSCHVNGRLARVAHQSLFKACYRARTAKDWELRADPQAFVQEVLRDELGKRCFVFLRDGTILNLSRPAQGSISKAIADLRWLYRAGRGLQDPFRGALTPAGGAF